jgi:hypothetical protein
VVFEPALEAQDVVEGDRAGAHDAHSRARLTEVIRGNAALFPARRFKVLMRKVSTVPKPEVDA